MGDPSKTSAHYAQNTYKYLYPKHNTYYIQNITNPKTSKTLNDDTRSLPHGKHSKHKNEIRVDTRIVFPLWQSRGNLKVFTIAHHTYDCASHLCPLTKFTLFGFTHVSHSHFLSPRPLQLKSCRRISFWSLIWGTQGQLHLIFPRKAISEILPLLGGSAGFEEEGTLAVHRCMG